MKHFEKWKLIRRSDIIMVTEVISHNKKKQVELDKLGKSKVQSE